MGQLGLRTAKVFLFEQRRQCDHVHNYVAAGCWKTDQTIFTKNSVKTVKERILLDEHGAFCKLASKQAMQVDYVNILNTAHLSIVTRRSGCWLSWKSI